ncbi:hypothetical protein GJAV_G00243580 [Gymnothorax javanicus]|nr:hypothetical protein GJAV_G00243580 [Gymnothorax javanicus]
MRQGDENLRSDLEKLQCHFTWGLRSDETDLNFLEVKLRDLAMTLPDAGDANLKGRAYNHLAYVKHLQGFDQEALGYLAKAEGGDSGDVQRCIVTFGNLAWMHHLMGDDARAQMYLQKLGEIDNSSSTAPPAALPREAIAEKAWSLLLFSKNHYEEAKDIFYEALQREPEDKEWNTGYAFALFHWDGERIKRGEDIPFSESRSLKQLQKALSLDPGNGQIMVHLGLLHQNNGKKLQAWTYMKEALDASPNDLSVALKVGKYLRKLKEYDMSLAALKRMLKTAPNSPQLHHEIASTYRWKSFTQHGETRDRALIRRSISHTVEEVRLNPSYVYPQLELALRYAEVGEEEKSQRIFKEMFARHDLSPANQQALHRTYGDFLRNHKNSMETAVKHYMEGMKLQNISTDWDMCRKRLRKLLAKRKATTAMHIEIQDFLLSCQDSSFRN